MALKSFPVPSIGSISSTVRATLQWLQQSRHEERQADQQPVCSVCKNLDLTRHEGRLANFDEIEIKHSDLQRSSLACVTCSILRATMARFYSLSDTSNPFFFRRKDYHPNEDIILTWNHGLKTITPRREFRDSHWPSLTFYCLGAGPQTPLLSSAKASLDDTRSDASLHRIQSWIQSCTTEHKHCHNMETKPLPDRVLDLGNTQSPAIRLLETRNEQAFYACLSHRWGQVQPLKTTLENIDSHRRGISRESLPLTFQDAVSVCRRLSIRYIWIDSLCIIQNSAADWERQAAKMASIYQNAFLTIAATKSHGPDVGLHTREHEDPVLFERIPGSEIGCGVSEDVFVRADYDPRGGIQHWDCPDYGTESENQWPLLTRAWVFQERVLSPRILHFAQNELVWECRTGIYCDCRRTHEDNTQDLMFRRLFGHQSLKTTTSTSRELRCLWYAIVEQYSLVLGNLTKEEDGFGALSGIAARISHLLHDKYAAGLWRNNMVEGLLWMSVMGTRRRETFRPKNWRAPTWSWASRTGQVSYKHTRLLRQELEVDEVYAKVRDLVCTPTGMEETGSIYLASLTLKGSVLHATIRIRPRPESSHWDENQEQWVPEEPWPKFTYHLIWNHDGGGGLFIPDEPKDIVDGQQVVGMRLARVRGKDYYLILSTSEPHGSGDFVRLGMFEGEDMAWNWLSPHVWKRRAITRYQEKERVLRVV